MATVTKRASSLSLPPSNTRERTLALFGTKAAIKDRNNVESRLVGSGFDILAEKEVTKEEVDGWGFGEGSDEEPYLLLVMERTSAFAVWRDLINAPGPNSLKNIYPPGSLMAPAVPQLVEEAIKKFFPQLPPLNSPLPSPKPGPSPRLFAKDPSVSPKNMMRKVLPPPSPLPEDEQVFEEEQEVTYEEEYEEEYYEEEYSRRVVRENGNTSPTFRARALPATHLQPDIQPRMSRAAALRMGLEVPEKKTPRPSGPKEPDLVTPGVNKRPLEEHEIPLSLAAPVIAPRQTRASALRSGGVVDKPVRKRDPNAPREKDLVTPGVNKRPLAEHELPKSLKGPTIAPRQTKAAMLRANGGAGSPKPSAAFRAAVSTPRRSLDVNTLSEHQKNIFAGVPGHKRRESVPVKSTLPPSITPRGTRSSSLRTTNGSDSTVTPPRSMSRSPNPSSPAVNGNGNGTATPGSRISFDGVPGHKRVEKFEVKSTRAPTIAPRMTKAAALRTGEVVSPPPRRERSLEDVPEENLFHNVPGHKRAERFEVKSTKPPTVAPRLTKTASLRVREKEPEHVPAWERRMRKRASVGGVLNGGALKAKVNFSKHSDEDVQQTDVVSEEGTVKDGAFESY